MSSKKKNSKKQQEQKKDLFLFGLSNKGMVTAAIVALIIGLIGYYFFTSDARGLGVAQKQILALVSLFVGIGASVAMLYQSKTGQDFLVFVREANVERKRVYWPSMSETRRMSILVLIVMAIVMFFLMIVDAILSWVISLGISA